MSSEWELDEGIKSIKSAWRREHTARANLEKMLEQAEAENAKLRELAAKMAKALRVGSEWCDRECSMVFGCGGMDECPIAKELLELGIEVPNARA